MKPPVHRHAQHFEAGSHNMSELTDPLISRAHQVVSACATSEGAALHKLEGEPGQISAHACSQSGDLC